MNNNLIYISLDIDGTPNHGSALYTNTDEVINFKCRPTLKGLPGQLEKLHTSFPTATFTLYYEASYVGYILQRNLTQKGYHCDVVALSSIPSPRGKQVKTDRIDAV